MRFTIIFLYLMTVLLSPVALAKTPIEIPTGSFTTTTVIFTLTKCTSKSFRSVRGDVPKEVDLSNDATARRILEKAGEFAQEKCPKERRTGNILVALYQGSDEEMAVRARNYGDEEFTWGEYSNKPLHKRRSEEKAKARETKRKVAAEKKKRKIEARRSREEQEKKEARDRMSKFVEQYSVEEWPSIKELTANPFVYEDKNVAIKATFSTMNTSTEGVFSVGSKLLIISNIPKGTFRSSDQVVLLSGIVLGKKLLIPNIATTGVPHLKYVGFHECIDGKCSDIYGK